MRDPPPDLCVVPARRLCVRRRLPDVGSRGLARVVFRRARSLKREGRMGVNARCLRPE